MISTAVVAGMSIGPTGPKGLEEQYAVIGVSGADDGGQPAEDVVQVLAAYENQRESYPSLRAFFPRIIALFEQLARDPDGLVQKRKQRLASMRPRVVDLSIRNDVRCSR
jgi:hypothetical protein